MKHAVYTSEENCPRCGKKLVYIDPDYHGWSYWCVYCNILTIPAKELKKLEGKMEKDPKSIGFIFAVASPFTEEQAESFRKALEKP